MPCSNFYQHMAKINFKRKKNEAENDHIGMRTWGGIPSICGKSQAWWHISVIPVLWRKRQETGACWSFVQSSQSLSSRFGERLSLKKKKNTEKNNWRRHVISASELHMHVYILYVYPHTCIVYTYTHTGKSHNDSSESYICDYSQDLLKQCLSLSPVYICDFETKLPGNQGNTCIIIKNTTQELSLH